MLRLLPLLLIVFACGKSHEPPGPADTVLYDSVVTQFYATYNVDLDQDNTKDLRLRWNYVPLQTNEINVYVMALNATTRIHALEQAQPVCRDSIYSGSFWTTSTHNCNGGANLLRVDTFIATPNIPAALLPAISVNTVASDSLLVYQKTSRIAMPSPGADSEVLAYGFFRDTTAGYMLVEVLGKRKALLLGLRLNGLTLENVVHIDP
ncbi:MAG TPA: hypothetical protein VFZ78_04155 [Flavisolibacter sp.]